MPSDYLKYVIDKNIHLIIIYIVLGFIVYNIIKSVMNKQTNKLKNNHQRTMHKLIQNIIKYIILILVMVSVLNILGVNVTSIIAGVGIASIVVGLALQDVMTDILSGISIVLEDQFDVGDYVEINGFEGTVLELGLKSTKIKNFQNTVKIIANRTITSVTNYSKDNPKIVIDVPIPYDIDNKEADKVLNKVLKRIEKEVPNQKDSAQLLGLQSFNSSNISYRILVSVKVNEQFIAKRQINRIVKEEFDKGSISIPFDIVEVRNGKNI